MLLILFSLRTRKYIYEVIENTYWELKKYNTFTYFKESVHRFVGHANYRNDLVRDKERNKM